MAYLTSTFNSANDLLTQLSGFAQGAGWTEDHVAGDRLFLTKGTVSVAFRHAASNPTWIAMYQHESFLNTGTQPGQHTNDSGQGEISASNTTLDNGRGFNVNNNGGGTFYFFADGDYIHAVIEKDANWYEHFGFGSIAKNGTWTGGEYCYGQYHLGGNTTGATNADAATSNWILDGGVASTSLTIQRYMASMRAVGLPGQGGASSWILAGNPENNVSGNDRSGQGRDHFQGGFRGGGDAQSFARFTSNNTSGFIPMYDIKCWWKDQTPLDRFYWLGTMKDVRGINVQFFEGADEIQIGGDTWKIFPARYKTNAGYTGGSTGNLGIAYRKV